MSIPLMILSDGVSGTSGLARITRELGERINANMSDVFRLATLGYGGVGTSKAPWQQYHICGDPIARGWFVPELYYAWNDFSKGERGVLLTIWDPSRMAWLVDPQACPDQSMREWLGRRPFSLWGYWPIDACGAHNKLPHGFSRIMERYDRNLAYSQWAADMMTEAGIEARSIPHGIDTSVWNPKPKQQGRKRLRKLGFTPLDEDSFLVGVVATNQARKDWGLAFRVCAELLDPTNDILLWCHTDAVQRDWSLPALADEFGLLNKVFITTPPISDEDMTYLYSACDVTLGIGRGEGFGYPIFESLACGVTCIHGDYAGAAEFMPEEMLIQPEFFYSEGQWNCHRPVYHSVTWSSQAALAASFNPSLPKELDWTNLWPRWEKWLREGVIDCLQISK